MAAFNVDAALLAAARIEETTEDLIALQNGCICCTLRGDLIEAISRLAAAGDYDCILVESTGISEPMQVGRKGEGGRCP